MWTLAVSGVLLLPVMSFVLPDWAVAIRAGRAGAGGADVARVDGSRSMCTVVATSVAAADCR